MSALPDANLVVGPPTVTYILSPKNGYPGWVQSGAIFPRPIREFLQPVGNMGTYPPPSSAGLVLIRPAKLNGAITHLSQPIPVSLPQQLPRPLVPISAVPPVSHSVSAGQQVSYSIITSSAGPQLIRAVSAARAPCPVTVVSAGQQVVRPLVPVTTGQQMTCPETTVSAKQQVPSSQSVSTVSKGKQVVPCETAASVGQTVQSSTAIPIEQRVSYPITSLSKEGVASYSSTISSVGQPFPRPILTGQRLPHLAAVSDKQKVTQSVTSISHGQQGTCLGTSVSPGQRKALTTVSSQYPKIAELCVGPVDLSLGPAKHVSKMTQKQIIEHSSPNRPHARPYPRVYSKTGIQVRPHSQPSTELRKTAYMLCRYCPFKALTKDQIQSHIIEEHPRRVVVVPKTFTCNYCPYVTSSELCMVRHLLTLHRSKILPPRSDNNGVNNLFSCSVCVFSADESTMINHMLDHYKDSASCNNCTSCVKIVHSSPSRKRKATAVQKLFDTCASRKSRDVDQFTAPQCNINSSAIRSLECSICNGKFSNRASLYAHQLQHPMSNKDSSASCRTVLENPSTSSTKVSHPEMAKSSNVDSSQLSIASESDGVPLQCEVTTVSPNANPKSKLSVSNAERQSIGDTASSKSTTSPAPNSDDFVPSKKRKLAMKIYRNSSGVYESERSDTPTTTVAEKSSDPVPSSPLKLCVQVPLQVLPCQKYIPTTVIDQAADEVQSPTRLQIPLDILPKRRELSVKAAKNATNDLFSSSSQESSTETCMPGKASQPLNTASSFNSSLLVSQTNDSSMEKKSDASEVVQIVNKVDESNKSEKSISQKVDNQENRGNQLTGEREDTCSKAKHCKVMANKLKEKLSNIHLKNRHMDLSSTGASSPVSQKPYDKKQHKSNFKVNNKSHVATASPVVPTSLATLKNGDFIDLTLEESSDDESIVTASNSALVETNKQIAKNNLLTNVPPKNLPKHSPSENKGSEELKPSQELATTGSSVTMDVVCSKPDCKNLQLDQMKANEKSSEHANGIDTVTKSAEMQESGVKTALAVVEKPADAYKTESERSEPTTATSEFLEKQMLEASISKDESANKNVATDPSCTNDVECESSKDDNEVVTSKMKTTGMEVTSGNKMEAIIDESDDSPIIQKEQEKSDTGNEKNDGQVNGALESGSSETAIVENNASASVPLFHPKLVRRPKNVRRNGVRLPSIAGTSIFNALNSEDLVICPYCPKRVLFRLLAAHVQFHGSDCEHKCKDCNFASSFKWALETHVPCHKEMPPDNARQITESEWVLMKDGNFSGDEEVEMAQRLLIREDPVPLPVALPGKRQIAKKCILKKSMSLPTGPNKKVAFGTAPITPTDSPAPLPVNKTKAKSMEDFFAQILNDRVKNK